jgi:hypothetical protein
MSSVSYLRTPPSGRFLGRVEEQAMRPADHPEDVLVAVELVARGPERHGPDAADAQLALGLDDPTRFAVST